VSRAPGNSAALTAVGRDVQKDSGCVLHQSKNLDYSSVYVQSKALLLDSSLLNLFLFYSNIFKPAQFSSYHCCISPVKKQPLHLECFSVKRGNSHCVLPSCCHCQQKLSWFVQGGSGICAQQFLRYWS